MIYHRIRDLREDKDIRQQDMADYLGVTQRSYSRYECGERTLTPEVLCKIADFHQVSVDYLLNRTDQKKINY
ncbi:MAG: helix-turn-helix transcriptional regulator [Lachnospiraceae bacterium]|nr:helix-turn-helix transcriptional regulator [Lachnospiraceae bacterium]